ncbi:MAG: ferredoxin [Planctomycetaceae bacterium]|nr:ferredoxin [Planctomycetaceae bacterium]
MSSNSPIDKSEIEKRRDRLTDIFREIVAHAEEQSLTRCPYRDAEDQCTAQIRCGNQRKPHRAGDPLTCGHDGTLDYRGAWDNDPEGVEEMRDQLSNTDRQDIADDAQATDVTVRCGDDVRELQTGQTLFDHADTLGVKVPTSCGRTGICHECVVEVRAGADGLSERTEAEAFLGGDYRLACQAEVKAGASDIEFALLRRAPRILTAQSHRATDLDPVVTRRGDHVFYGDEQIDDYRGHIYGLAVDAGTTTVVAELVDLETGESKYVASFENPQRFGGSDVLHRISYDAGAFSGELHHSMINTLNGEIREICAALEISRHEIYEIYAVGNATMRDLLLGLDVQSIGQKPYKSTIEHAFLAGERETTAVTESARKYRLYANRHARLVGGPLIASHVGADAAATLVAEDLSQSDELGMIIDVGTNTEVIIGNKDRLIAASCPAGPAFEGGLVKFGMTGCDGAIETIRLTDGRFDYETIGGIDPIGICGSGLIDLLAELRRSEMMNPMGTFADKADEVEIVPEHGITFSREDASHLAQAKAANNCGQLLLMRELGVGPTDIDQLYLAGGFANYIDPLAAIDIGFIAPVPIDRVKKVGNAALQGARELLVSQGKRRDIDRLIRTIEHVELEMSPDFFELFVEGCQFERMVGF